MINPRDENAGQSRAVPDGGTKLEVRCLHCAMRLPVERIRDAEIRSLADHLRTRHLALGLLATATPDDVLDHFRAPPTLRWVRCPRCGSHEVHRRWPTRLWERLAEFICWRAFVCWTCMARFRAFVPPFARTL